jgi:hypothetical protein
MNLERSSEDEACCGGKELTGSFNLCLFLAFIFLAYQPLFNRISNSFMDFVLHKTRGLTTNDESGRAAQHQTQDGCSPPTVPNLIPSLVIKVQSRFEPPISKYSPLLK